MPVGLMNGSMRARNISSLTNKSTCGGNKKSGLVSSVYHRPRANWGGCNRQCKSLFALFPTCAKLVDAKKITMNPQAGGVGRRFR